MSLHLKRLTNPKLHRHGTRQHRRRRPHLPGKPRVLILTEGTKTETNYFNGLKTANRLTSVVIRSLHGQPGPLGLFQRAAEVLSDDHGWDDVYCVVDHDGRDSALRRLERKLIELDQQYPDTRVQMILSEPCFELWLLLHFQFTDRPLHSTGSGRTSCDKVIVALQNYVPNYQKNAPHLFEQFKNKVDEAVVNAAQLNGSISDTSQHSPRTDVGQMVCRLLEIANL